MAGAFSVLASFAQVVAAIGGVFLIETLGRRMVWTLSLAGITVIDFVYTLLLDREKTDDVPWWQLIAIFLFLFMFGFGAGPIPWFSGAELFPSSLTPLAMSIIAAVNWLFAGIVLQIRAPWAQKISVKITSSPVTFVIFGVLSLVGAVVGFCYVKNPGPSVKKAQVLHKGIYEDLVLN